VDLEIRIPSGLQNKFQINMFIKEIQITKFGSEKKKLIMDLPLLPN